MKFLRAEEGDDVVGEVIPPVVHILPVSTEESNGRKRGLPDVIPPEPVPPSRLNGRRRSLRDAAASEPVAPTNGRKWSDRDVVTPSPQPVAPVNGRKWSDRDVVSPTPEPVPLANGDKRGLHEAVAPEPVAVANGHKSDLHEEAAPEPVAPVDGPKHRLREAARPEPVAPANGHQRGAHEAAAPEPVAAANGHKHDLHEALPEPAAPADGHTRRLPDVTPPEAAPARINGARPATPWIRPDVLDSCVVALRRMGGPKLRSVGVTSSVRGEGRSTVAAAMAVIQATEYRRKTILIELDGQRPSAAEEFGLAESPGVAEFVRGGVDIEECIQWPSKNLGVVVAGADLSMAKVLGGSGAEGIVAALSRRADTLVLDLPPLARGAGGVQLVDLCESVALVVRAGEVSTHRIEEAAAALSTPPFVILNGVKSAAPRWVRRMLGMR